MINFESFYPCSTVFLKINCCNISETRPCCCVSEVRIRAKPDQVLGSLPEASNDVSPSHIPMTFCDRQTSVIVYTRPYNRVHTSYLLLHGPTDMPGIPQAAFMTPPVFSQIWGLPARSLFPRVSPNLSDVWADGE